MTTITVSPSMCVAASDAALRLGIALPASQAGAIIKAALTAAPAPSKLEPVAIQEAAKAALADARVALDETYHFASTSPGSQDNINLVLDKLDELEGMLAAVSGNPCLQKLREGEPFFVLLGRDRNAAEAVRYWAGLREADRGASDKVDDARQIAGRMDAYRGNDVPSAPLPAAPSAAQPVAPPLAKLLSLVARVEEKVNAEGGEVPVSRIVALTVSAINEARDALADEREFHDQLVAMLKKMFDAPTMAAGYAILADFAAQFYPGQPVALQNEGTPAHHGLLGRSLSALECKRCASYGRPGEIFRNGEWDECPECHGDESTLVKELRAATAARRAHDDPDASRQTQPTGQGEGTTTPMRCSQCGWLGDATELGAEGECGGEGCPGTAVSEISTPADMIEAWQDSEGHICGSQLAEAGLIAQHPASTEEAKHLDILPGDSVWDLTDAGKAVLNAARGEGASDGL